MYEIVEVYIDSDDLTYGTLDRPTVTLSNPITQVVGFSVAEAQIPLSFYNVDTDCNVYYLKGPGAVSSIARTIAPSDYATGVALAAGVEAAATGIVTVAFVNGFLEFTAVVNNALDSAPVISFDANGSHAADVLGFDVNRTYSFTWTGTVWQLTAPKQPSIEMPKYLYLCSNLSELAHLQIRVVDFNGGQIVAKVPLQDAALLKASVTSSVPVVHYSKAWSSDPNTYFRFTETVVSNLTFYFTRANRQTPIPFRGKSFSLTLLFLCSRGLGMWNGKNFEQQ